MNHNIICIWLTSDGIGADGRRAECSSSRLNNTLRKVFSNDSIEVSTPDSSNRVYTLANINGSKEFATAASAGKLRNSRIIFAADLDESGVNIEAMNVIGYLNLNPTALEGSIGGVIVDGRGELFTKDLGRRLVFAANMAGCAFPGKPLVEATGSLANFAVSAKLWGESLDEAYVKSCRLLVEKVASFKLPVIGNSDCRDSRQTDSEADPPVALQKPKILAIHAGNKATSNSFSLWREAASHLNGLAEIDEISIRNGQVLDCRGCKYEACLHFGENAGCFYGGVMVEKVYPAILKSDVLVLICPNYNDSVSANIMAFINRLTALFRTNDFSRKRIYAIVVSGYSGGDIVAQQIIGAINMNKNFILPPHFAMLETANDPGTALKLPGIKERAEAFAHGIISYRIPD